MKKLSFLFVVLLTCGITYAQQKSESFKGVLVKKTQPLRDLKTSDEKNLEIVFGADGKRIWPKGIAKPNYELPANPVSENYVDPVLQKSIPAAASKGASVAAGVISGIEGMATGVQPMDPTICVGSNHVIELVNALPSSKMKIWNKSGTVVVNEVTLQSLTGFPGYGDPIAIYDQLSDRYIVTEFIIKGYNNSTENGMSVMVSQTGDPTGSWNVYKWTIPENYTLDYPKWSVWSDGIYLHTNNFSQTSGSYLSSYFAVFNKDDMYNGNATFRNIRITQSIGNGYATCPAQLQGTTVPSGGPLYITENNSNQATVISTVTNWTNSTLTQSNAGNISLASFNETVCGASRGACATQPSGGSSVEVLSGRIMNQPIYRVLPGYNGIVFCFTVNAGSNKAGVRWAEIKNTGSGWSLNQEATWSPNTNHQFMPSMAYDVNGNIGLAYSTSSTSTFLSVRYTARKACDPLGQMTLAESVLKAGTAVSSGSRWGDYGHLVADPDGNSLWMVSMYGKSGASGGKGSYISRFDLESCVAGGCNAPTGLASSNLTTTTATISFTAASGANNYDVDYKAASSGTWINVATASTATSFNLSGLVASTTYDFRVRSNCTGSSSSYTQAQFTTSAAGGACPGTLDVSTNGTRSGAAIIPFNTDVKGLISPSGDLDYYKFVITTGGTITLTLGTLPGDYDLFLQRGVTILARSENSGTTSETITYTVAAGTTYFARVFGYNGANSSTQCYTLRVQLGTASVAAGENVIASGNTGNISATLTPNPVKSILNVKVPGLNKAANIQVVDINGKVVLSKITSQSNTPLDVSRLTKGVYMIVINEVNGKVMLKSKFIKE